MILKRIKLNICIVLMFFISPVILSQTTQILAQEGEDASGIDVDFMFVTDYAFRGDAYGLETIAAKAADREDNDFKYSDFPIIGFFQPNIAFSTPIEGLYFNIWLNIAFSARDYTDSEGFEAGTGSLDEVDYTIGYENTSRIGYFGFGVNAYTYVHPKAKIPADIEVFFNYAIPQVDEQLIFSVYSSLNRVSDSGADEDYSLGVYDYIELAYDTAWGMSSNTDFLFRVAYGLLAKQEPLAADSSIYEVNNKTLAMLDFGFDLNGFLILVSRTWRLNGWGENRFNSSRPEYSQFSVLTLGYSVSI